MYLALHQTSMGCVLGQHDECGKKEQAIYYLTKNFANYESRYPLWKIHVAPFMGNRNIAPSHSISYYVVDLPDGSFEVFIRKGLHY